MAIAAPSIPSFGKNPIPNIKKQDEVSLFLSKLHQELNSEIEILRQLKNQKKYLLCNMFI